jgi:hypothetical protein
MDPAAMDRIATRLSAVEDLYFPSSFLRSAASSRDFPAPAQPPPSPPRRQAELRSLLARDAPLFLERYGSALAPDELAAFDALSPDYEVDWHLRRLRAAAAGQPRPAWQVRNRRRAYLHRLLREGDYFSEDAMRERDPYLHHEYLGRFQDPLGRAMARPGERWSDTLMRRAEEAVIVDKIRGEQIRRGVHPSEWVGGGGTDESMQEEEEEEDDEEDDDDVMKEKGAEVTKASATEVCIPPISATLYIFKFFHTSLNYLLLIRMLEFCYSYDSSVQIENRIHLGTNYSP